MPRSIVILAHAVCAAFAVALLATTTVAAAEPATFAVGDTPVRVAAPEGICVLDAATPHEAALIAEVDREFADTTVFAVLAVCSSLARGGSGGLTALFVLDHERDQPSDRHVAQFVAEGVTMRAAGVPFFEDRARFIAEVPPLTWGHVGEATIAVLEHDRMRFEVGATEMPDGLHLLLTGATPLRGFTARVMTFNNLRSDDELNLVLRLQQTLLGSLRTLNPS